MLGLSGGWLLGVIGHPVANAGPDVDMLETVRRAREALNVGT